MKGIRMENLEINVPVYRAKKIDRDKWVEGYLIKSYNKYFIANDKASKICDSEGGTVLGYDITYEYADAFEIDPTTLAIHFPSMISSEGKKIFASLSEDGKGGDCTFMQNGYNETFCWDSLNGCIVLKSRNYECRCFRNGCRNETNFNTYKIIGIQQ